MKRPGESRKRRAVPSRLRASLRLSALHCSIFSLALVLMHASPSSASERVRIGVFSLFRPESVEARLATGSTATIAGFGDLAANEFARVHSAGKLVRVEVFGADGLLRSSFSSNEVRLMPRGAATIQLRISNRITRAFRGEVGISATPGSGLQPLRIIVTTELESAVASAVASEFDGVRPFESLKTLAVVSRTYISANAGRHRLEGFNLCDTTHCQLYKGEDGNSSGGEPLAARAAADATHSQVLLFNDRLMEGYYSAVCGGMTLTPEMVWGGRPVSGYPYERVRCVWCRYVRNARWERSAAAAGVIDAISSEMGVRLSSNASITVELYEEGGFAAQIAVIDRGRTIHISADHLRRAVGRRLGWNTVLSPSFTIERAGDIFRFRGRGFGSQVGLCLAGAGAQARDGHDYRSILRFYYPQARLCNLDVLKGLRDPDDCLPRNSGVAGAEVPAFWGVVQASAVSPLALSGVSEWIARLGAWLMALGALGLFLIALLDSAFVPMPSGPDIVMITLSALDPAWMPVYALTATAGSTIGCAFLFLVARRAGVRALGKMSQSRRERIEGLLGRYDVLAVIVPSLLPPPFPFKAFVICAGVFKLRLPRFVIGIVIGRGLRFLAAGWLAVKFGDDAMRLIAENGLIVLLAVGLVIPAILVVRFYRRRRRRESPTLIADELQPRD